MAQHVTIATVLQVGAVSVPLFQTTGDATAIRLFVEANGQFSGLRGSATRVGNIIYELPTVDPTANQVLAAAAPVGGVAVLSWVNAGGGGHAILSASHTDSLAAAVTRGALIVGNVTPAWASLAAGAGGSLLSSDGTDPSWQTNIKIAGYLHVGSSGAPFNVTAGDLTVARLAVGNQAFTAGLEVQIVGDAAASGYLRIGAVTAPTNVTAGDLTVVRLNVGNIAFTTAIKAEIGGNAEITGYLNVGDNVINNTQVGDLQAIRFLLGGPWTFNAAGERLAVTGTMSNALARNFYIIQPTLGYTANNSNVIRGMYYQSYLANTGAFTTNSYVAQQIEIFHRQTGTIASIIGVDLYPLKYDNNSVASPGTITQVFGVRIRGFANSATRVAAVTTLVGLGLIGPESAGLTVTDLIDIQITDAVDSTIATHIGLDIGALTRAATNFGIRNASNMVQTGYLRIGAVTAPTNVTAGDLTAVRLKVGDGAFGAGVEFSVTGDGALSGFLRIGSETAPALTGAGDLTMSGRLVATPSAAQNVTAVGYTILANATVVQLTADASYTLTSAPTVADGQDGQMLLIVNVDTVDVVTLQDQGTLAGSNLRLSAVGIALGPRASILLMYSSTVGDWIQVGQTNVI